MVVGRDKQDLPSAGTKSSVEGLLIRTLQSKAVLLAVEEASGMACVLT